MVALDTGWTELLSVRHKDGEMMATEDGVRLSFTDASQIAPKDVTLPWHLVPVVIEKLTTLLANQTNREFR